MYPNVIDFEAATERLREMRAFADRERRAANARSGQQTPGVTVAAARRRVGLLLVRLGERIDGTNLATVRVADAGQGVPCA